jgi:hypothetical protein
VSVAYGYFTALVNAGGEFGTAAFSTDQARWLELAVKCGGETNYTLLAPRHRIAYTPPTHSHWGQSWSGTGTGLTLSSDGTGLIARGSYGVFGQSTDLVGVYGYASSTSATNYGLYGLSESSTGVGVGGFALADSGTNYGVYGRADSTRGRGVKGHTAATSGYTYGVYGEAASSNGAGVYGEATADSGTTYGVYGESESTAGFGVYGITDATSGTTYGVYGRSESPSGRGVFGFATASSGTNYGVRGVTNSPTGYGIYSVGDAHVSGDFTVSGDKAFKIDHPLDPAHQYLYHYSIESSEVLDVYSGNATLNQDGQAWVQFPDWFEAINTDFRYQLTPIGAFAPLYIAQGIQEGRFLIAGGTPGLVVSWQVVSRRNDPYQQAHPPVVEQPKPPAEQGTYIFPELYGQPAELGLDYLAPLTTTLSTPLTATLPITITLPVP